MLIPAFAITLSLRATRLKEEPGGSRMVSCRLPIGYPVGSRDLQRWSRS
jgi:hypothetical protein